jgi:hypothetical protein
VPDPHPADGHPVDDGDGRRDGHPDADAHADPDGLTHLFAGRPGQ